MKSIIAILFLAVLAVGTYYLVDVEFTKEARLPNVDINVSGGQMPEVQVKTGSIKVTKENVTVKVPDVDMKMVDKNVSIPSLEVTTPSESTN